MNNIRKLASIREVAVIKSIDGADMIEVAVVDGWECVVKKSEGFKAGDKVVYIEIDSIVPERAEFEFLRERKFRVRTIKLRKQISQGLVLPLNILPDKKYNIGDDVTEILGIKKYDPEGEAEKKLLKDKYTNTKNPIVKFLLKFGWFRKLYLKPKRKNGFPEWIVKTDEDRIQNKVAMFNSEKDLNTEFIVTEKIDGQSATYFLEKAGKKFKFGVCSRNVNLSDNPNHDGSYWTVAQKFDIESVLRELIGDYDRIVLQGENFGEGIQGNKYKVSGYDFMAFNLIYPDRKIDTLEMQKLLEPYGIKTVPVIDTNFKLKNSISEMVDYARGDSVLLKRKREGVVIRNYNRNISFKVINPDFLLEEKN